MGCTGNDRLSVFYSIEQVLIELEKHEGYWRLKSRHRHYSGELAQCDPEQYEALTVDEIVDVLEALLRRVDSSGFPQLPG